MELIDSNGRHIHLGPKITEGGEGIIFEIPSDASRVAKIFHKPLHQQSLKAKKLQFQCLNKNKELLSISAWPQTILHDSRDSLKIHGFIMPRVSGKEIHFLYSPHDRQNVFPSAGWDFLIHVAKNCATAFETLHENGVVMADVNEKNLIVTKNGIVYLIDCDSYQLRNGNEKYYCDVGVQLWTPPELQKLILHKGYSNLERTPNHDRFGLAVLIFELLFMGRHPYAGVITDHHRHYELHEAIQEYLFAFSPKAWIRGTKPPPHTLSLSTLPDKLITLFERSFLPGSEINSSRPTGREWINELSNLFKSQKTCNYDNGHKYWNGNSACPWCQIIAHGGPNFFITVSIQLGLPSASGDITLIWTTIQKIANGNLMLNVYGRVQVPIISANPMPILRPNAPQLKQPCEPMHPGALTSFRRTPPILPLEPTFKLPKQTKLASFRKIEDNLKASLLGFETVFLITLITFYFELYFASIISVSEAIVFIFLWAIIYDIVNKKKKQFEFDNIEYEMECQKAKEAFSIEYSKYKALKAKIEQEHENYLAEEEQKHLLNNKRIEAEYQLNFNLYITQQSLYQKAWDKYKNDKNIWDKEANLRVISLAQAKREYDDVSQRLANVLSAYRSKIGILMPNLDSTYQIYLKTKDDELLELKALELKKREVQLRQYLDSQLIRNNTIPGIGPAKEANLCAYGCESALDITQSLKVPGIGPVLLSNLLAWRAKCESQFKYNPNTPLPQAEVQAIKLKYSQLRQSLLIELRGGAGALSALETTTNKTVQSLESQLKQLAKSYAQAIADHKECS